MMKRLVSTAAALLVATGFAAASIPARAADLPPAAPAPLPVFNWNGFYAGASFVYGQGKTDDSYTTSVAQPVLVTRHSFHGPMGGVEAGYCGMGGLLVVCGEVAGAFGRERGTNFGFATTNAATSIQSTLTTNWLVTAGPKLGFTVDRNQLFIYASGGGAFGEVSMDSISTVPGRLGAGSTSTTKGGWFVGAGMERLLTPNLGVKFEYKRVDLGGFDNTLTGGAVVRTSGLLNNIFSAGVNFHFNSGLAYGSY